MMARTGSISPGARIGPPGCLRVEGAGFQGAGQPVGHSRLGDAVDRGALQRLAADVNVFRIEEPSGRKTLALSYDDPALSTDAEQSALAARIARDLR